MIWWHVLSIKYTKKNDCKFINIWIFKTTHLLGYLTRKDKYISICITINILILWSAKCGSYLHQIITWGWLRLEEEKEEIYFWLVTEMGLASTGTPWVYASMSSRTSRLLPLKDPLRCQYHSFSAFASVRALL